MSRFVDNLKTLSSLLPLGCVKHISCYELTVEPGTILKRQLAAGRVALPDEELLADEYAVLAGWCRTNGFEQYEVSNYSLPGYRSRHNSRYWDRTPYLGVGAAAHSFDGRHRRWNTSDVALYSSSETAPYEEETLTDEDAFNEYLMTALRTVEGVDKRILERMPAAGRSEEWKKAVARFVAAGLLVDTATHLVPSASGLLHADGIAAECMV